MTDNMRSFLESCCAVYLDLAPGPKLRDDRPPSPRRFRGSKRDSQVCSTCSAKRKKGMDLADVLEHASAMEPPPGALALIASRVLMQVLYVARMARPDLLKAVNTLALGMCYPHSCLDKVQVG